MKNQEMFSAIEQYQSFTVGQAIFREGDLAEHMYIVADGEVDVMLGAVSYTHLTLPTSDLV